MEKKEKREKSGYRIQDAELEKALLSGDHAEILEQYIGEASMRRCGRWPKTPTGRMSVVGPGC